MSSTEDVVRRYFAVVGDLGSTVDDLRAVIAPDAVFTEMPNPIAPNGKTRDVAETVAAFEAGRGRLEAQSLVIDELLVAGERAAVRSTWRGTIAGSEIVAHMAGFVTVRDGLVVDHSTYDCYEPFQL